MSSERENEIALAVNPPQFIFYHARPTELKRKETVCEQPRQAISGFISQRTQANVKVNSPPYEYLKILLEFWARFK